MRPQSLRLCPLPYRRPINSHHHSQVQSDTRVVSHPLEYLPHRALASDPEAYHLLHLVGYLTRSPQLYSTYRGLSL